MNKILNILMLLLTVMVSQAATIDHIISQANLASFYAGDDGRSDARMIIVDNKDNKQMRQFVILRKDLTEGGDQNFLVVFSRPSDVKDTVFLVHKKVDDEDHRWLYLPALDLEKRISSSDNRTSFVGSDFFYEDVSGRNPQADLHELLKQDDAFYYIKSSPKDPNAVEFKYYTMQIDKQTHLPMVVEYFDQSEAIYRRVEVVEVVDVQGHPTVMKSKVSNLKTGGYTLMEFRRPAYDLGMEDDVFTVRSLRNPPKNWLSGQ
ncbi:outer membrane lipoprotein-sorting protein [Marinicella litoralis]|uniref:Outer membrane lipoprotein-sorting protein n=1 Tax=Marinicella litoralis TaxID=644220 RepID=A0A4R6XW54_9GAMM|nr:outer membrane lipoprotein-sorting protein [Marinicella litoralis]TDR22357.1 outer membrane lipoprotein-sorting protein [Marinicella litoralis]